jgi:orotate phosphoribosyltransferase
MTTQRWVSMREAARILQAEGFKVNPNLISRLANRGTIQTKDDPIDARVRLVDLNELRQLFAYRRNNPSIDDNDDSDDNI